MYLNTMNITNDIVIDASKVDEKTAWDANSGSLSNSMDVKTTFTAVGAPRAIIRTCAASPLIPNNITKIRAIRGPTINLMKLERKIL